MSLLRSPRGPIEDARYVRPPQPIRFPVEESVPETKRHLILRTFLFQLLGFALGPSHSVGSDQFVYWNARDPRRCLAPDVFVRLGVPDTRFDTWKTWEHGAPDVAIEIVSPSDTDGISLDEKLARYHEAGVRELVRFDPDAAPGTRIRAWDRVEGDLVERAVENERTPCGALGATWVVARVDASLDGLRLEDEGGRLVESQDEVAARRIEADARRIRELEDELRRR